MTPSAEIKSLSSLATREAYLELVPQFERASGRKVVTTWAGTVDIINRIAAGESFDLIIAANSTIDDFIQAGRVENGSRVDIARTGIGVAVRRGAQRSDIGSAEALKRVLLGAKSVAYSTGPSGVDPAALFERMGIAAEIKAKSRQVPPGTTVEPIIAGGDVETGFQQMSELLHADGIDAIGPLPAEIPHTRHLLRDSRRRKGAGRRLRAGRVAGCADRQRRCRACGAAARLNYTPPIINAVRLLCTGLPRPPRWSPAGAAL